MENGPVVVRAASPPEPGFAIPPPPARMWRAPSRAEYFSRISLHRPTACEVVTELKLLAKSGDAYASELAHRIESAVERYVESLAEVSASATHAARAVRMSGRLEFASGPALATAEMLRTANDLRTAGALYVAAKAVEEVKES